MTHFNDLPELITREQLSEYTGIAVNTLAQWAVNKTGPKVIKLGRAVRYRRDDVAAWLEAAATASA